MDKYLTIRLIAPYGIIWEGKASFTTIPGQAGTFGVYPGHCPHHWHRQQRHEIQNQWRLRLYP